MVVRVIVPSIVFRSPDDLEVVSVKVERMLPGVVVVQDNLNYLALLEDESMSVAAVYHGV